MSDVLSASLSSFVCLEYDDSFVNMFTAHTEYMYDNEKMSRRVPVIVVISLLALLMKIN